jgi:hypothetical protein
VDLQPRYLSVDVGKVLSDYEGELLVLVESSGEVEVYGHGIVAQRVEVGVEDLGERDIAKAGDGGREDTDAGLNHELDGRVVEVQSHRLREGTTVDTDAVDDQSEGALRIELPASHRHRNVEIVGRGGTGDWDLGAVAEVKEAGRGGDGHSTQGKTNVSRRQERVRGPELDGAVCVDNSHGVVLAGDHERLEGRLIEGASVGHDELVGGCDVPVTSPDGVDVKVGKVVGVGHVSIVQPEGEGRGRGDVLERDHREIHVVVEVDGEGGLVVDSCKGGGSGHRKCGWAEGRHSIFEEGPLRAHEDVGVCSGVDAWVIDVDGGVDFVGAGLSDDVRGQLSVGGEGGVPIVPLPVEAAGVDVVVVLGDLVVDADVVPEVVVVLGDGGVRDHHVEFGAGVAGVFEPDDHIINVTELSPPALSVVERAAYPDVARAGVRVHVLKSRNAVVAVIAENCHHQLLIGLHHQVHVCRDGGGESDGSWVCLVVGRA